MKRFLHRIIPSLGFRILMLLALLGTAFEANCQHSWTLYEAVGGGISAFRDEGTSPLSYHGPQGLVGLGFVRQGSISCSIYAESSIAALHHKGADLWNHPQSGGYLRLEGSATHGNTYKFGVGLLAFADLRYNPSLGNTSVMPTGLLSPTFVFNFHRLRWLDICIEAAPYGWYLRPGYGYNDNFTADNSSDNLLPSNLEWSGRILPGFRSSISYCWGKKDRPKLKAGYRWEYFSTGQSGTYRWAAASHSIMLSIPLFYSAPSLSNNPQSSL